MMRPIFVLSLFLSGAPAAAPEPTRHLPGYEPPAWLMESITALLDAARRYGIDPLLAFSVAFQESELKPWARSRREVMVDGVPVHKIIARGLMQISLQYQDELVRRYLGWHPSNFDWRNPVHSAKLGCSYLSALIKRYGTWGGVASYNCGPGRYQELWNGRMLPEETVDYLKKVLG